MQVLHMQGNQDPFQAGAHLVAALLNWANGFYGPQPGGPFILTKEQIISMGNAVLCGGMWEAATGVFWSAEQVVAYLKTTMDPYSWTP
jgi:hypothetical protein